MQAVLGTLQGLQSAHLAEGAGVHGDGLVRPDDDPDQVHRGGDIADAPAAHGIGLGEGLHRHGALPHARQGGDGDVPVSVVQDLLIGLVRQHQQIVAAAEPGQLLQVLPVHHGAGGVAGGAQDQQPGLVRNGLFRRVQIEAIAVLLVQGHIHGLRLGDLGKAGIGDVAGVGNEHLVSGLQQGKQGGRHSLLAAAGDHDLLGRVHLQAVHGLQLPGDGPAQLYVAIVGGVGRHALVQGGLGRFLDVVRRVKIGLAHLKVDDLPALGLQGVGFFQHAPDAGKGHPLHLCGFDITHLRHTSFSGYAFSLFRYLPHVFRIILQHH